MIGPNVGYDNESYETGREDGYQDGVVDGEELAPMFNGYLSEMRKDQRDVFGHDFDAMPHEELKRELCAHAYSAVDELAELMAELQWKPWKTSDSILKPGSSASRVADEAADLLHFVAHILNIADVTDENLNESMINARAKNRGRQQDGYSYAAEQPEA